MSATWWNSNNWINIRHPGYDDECNVLLLLYAFDHPLGGIHYQTALTACGILAGNRWDGVLTTSRTYSPQSPPSSGILVAKDAYFHLPDWQPKATDTVEDALLACRYPIVRNFEDWSFPHDNLPPIWADTRKRLSDVGSDESVNNPETQAPGSAEISDDEAAAMTRARCQICDHPKCDAGPWMLVPNLFWIWFARNNMRIYFQDMNATPPAEVGHEEAKTVKLQMARRPNVITFGQNCLGERTPCNLWKALAGSQFGFAPKFELGGNATLVAHMFAPQKDENGVYWNEGLHSANNSLLQRSESLSLEMLFSNFALTVFQNLDLFLQAGVPRDLSVLDHNSQLQYFTASSVMCAESFVPILQWSVYHDTSFRFQSPLGPVICDSCGQSFYGLRYKCIVCSDFDYCSVCIEDVDSTHPSHPFLPMHKSDLISESTRNHQREESRGTNLTVAAETNIVGASEDDRTDQTALKQFLSAQDMPDDTNMTYYDLPIMSDDDITIRLLVLWPGSKFTPIQGHLIVSPLLQCPPYEALSYTWGNPAEKSPINISGAVFSAQRNLKSALHHLRYPDKVRILWVDALCINQSDNEEKSVQVARMGDIYRNAEQTTVWLGEAEDDSHETIEECKRACQHFASEDLRKQNEGQEDVKTVLRDVEDLFYSFFERDSETESNMQFLRRLGWDNPDFDQIPKHMIPDNITETTFFRILKLVQPVFRAENLGPFAIERFLDGGPSLRGNTTDSVAPTRDGTSNDTTSCSDSGDKIVRATKPTDSVQGETFSFQHVKGIQALLKRAWFQRLWIIQEVALASKVTIICGYSSIDWWVFNLGVKMAVMHGKGIGIVSEPSFSTSAFICQAHERIFRTPEERTEAANEFGLLHVLQMFRKQKATDPRDKIFGLLSLSEEDSFEVDVDYDDTVEEVYAETAIRSILLSGSLDILSIPRLAGGRREMYSWVPDWSDERLLPNPLNGYPNNSGAYTRRVFHATGDSRSELCTLSTIEPLPLRGYEFDRISVLGKPLEPDTSWTDPIRVEKLVSSAVQALNPEGLIRSILQQCTRTMNLWDTAIEWRDIALSGDARYPTGEDTDTVFWKTLQATVYIDSEEDTHARHDGFFRDVDVRRNRCLKVLGLANFDNPWTAAKAMIDSLNETASGSETETVWKQFLCADVVLERAVMRRLARTTKGYLALLPFDAEVTNSIVLLQGGKTPYVVRRKGGSWEFVGDCYVHGIMDGEAWDESRLEDILLV